MRFILFPLVFLLLIGCSKSTAGVTIESGKIFILGEYMEEPYKAKLENEGEFPIAIKLVDKTTRQVTKQVNLAPGRKTSLTVLPESEVQMLNLSKGETLVRAVMSENVSGMRYLSLDEEIPIRNRDWRSSASTDQAISYDFQQKVTIPVGKTFYFSEDQPGSYSAIIQNRGGRNVEVKIRDRATGKQTQGFGLGPYSKPLVHVSSNEVLTLVNRGDRPAGLQLKLSEDLSGGTIK